MSAISLRPLANRVLVRPDPVPERTASGLHLVEHWRAEQTGHIVAIGAGCDQAADGLNVDDWVIFPPTAGQALRLQLGEGQQEETYLVLRVEDLVAVMTPNDASAREGMHA